MEYLNNYKKYTDSPLSLTQREAVNEILTFIDAACFSIFTVRDLWKENLDMRGLVITPSECEEALRQGFDQSLPGDSLKNQLKKELKELFFLFLERAKKSAEGDTRIFNILKEFSLNSFEILCLILAAAPEWDRKYERIFGYIQDNVAARQPTFGLALSLYEFICEENACENSFIYDETQLSLLLRQEKRLEKESHLSAALVLNDTILNYIQTGTCFLGIWKEIAMISKNPEPSSSESSKEPQLIVSVWNLDLCRKEENRSLKSMAGELAGACKVLRISKILLRSSLDEKNQEETAKAGVYLEQLLSKEGFLVISEVEPDLKGIQIYCSSVKTSYLWEDLILEEESKALLRQLCNQVKYRKLVKDEWGFGKKDPYGNGLSALFYGPPGTGKTMAAQVIAAELQKELFKVDISRLVSKYVGETEKQISSLFEAAGKKEAILFFDEADGLFAKRSEVTGSNDRYANMETGFLLQKLEEYNGISILATNFVNNIDDAFKRRIRFLIRFPFPAQNMRLLLWKRMFPETAPLKEPLKYESLAGKFELSGSSIREVALSAAYLAAASGRGILNEDILNALKTHYVKYGKHLTPEDLDL